MHTLASEKHESWLSWFLRGILIVGFLILITRLFEIQIIKGSYYRELSEENRIRHVPLPAPRGRILAGDGEVLVGNLEVKKRIKFNDRGIPELIENVEGATPEEIVTDYKRYYYLADKFAHGSGYVGAPTEEQVDKINPECPEKGPARSDVFVGKNGLELYYDCMLSGTPGEVLIEVDTNGNYLRALGRRDPVPGSDLKISVDIDLQAELATLMSGKKGAAVVANPDGQILAFYSEPSFDPNLFITKEDDKKITALFKDTNLPFFNRVMGGTFHPGSVFKPVTAIAALEGGAIDSQFTYVDTGVITVNEFTYTNWYFTQYGGTEGKIALPRAIARSTDTFFYKIGELAGPDSIADWSQTFGLNSKTGIDLKGEVEGLIPSPEWKKRVKKENWFLGNTYHMAIGQGDVAVTPLAINRYISSLATGGRLCQPKFILNGEHVCNTVDIKKTNLEPVIQGMREACTSGGTAFTFFDFQEKFGGIEVACKTGTAEVEDGGEPHSWFVAFAPKENPQIITTILVENGGQGSEIAGPIARKIFDYYFAGARTN